jgi:hypothetical protein
MIVGFTGTRGGMTSVQRRVITELLRDLQQRETIAGLHGDCVGADADFHAICRELGVDVLIRPCTSERYRAHCDGTVVAEPTNPMARNRAIVQQADVMLATPPTNKELKRSGTWSTIRMARRHHGVVVVLPNGTICHE